MVYLNKEDWPSLYKSEMQKENQPNQSSYRLNFLQNVLEKQGQINQQITNEFLQVQSSVQQANFEHNHRIDQVAKKIDQQENINIEFITLLKTQHETNEEIMKRLHRIEKINDTLVKSMENEALIHQVILDQIATQEHTTREISRKMEEFNVKSEELTKQLGTQDEIYKDFSEKLGLQEVYHQTVMDRLDQQDALTQKLARQLENIRNIIFERATFLVEKFETNFSRISKPVQRFFIQHEENKDEIRK